VFLFTNNKQKSKKKFKKNLQLCVVVHDCNPSTQEVDGGKFQVQGQPGPHSEFQASLGYIAGH
jgi:hypothetical protein